MTNPHRPNIGPNIQINVHTHVHGGAQQAPQQQAPQQQAQPAQNQPAPRSNFLPYAAGAGSGVAGGFVGYIAGSIAEAIIHSMGLHDVAPLAPYAAALFGAAWAGTAGYRNVDRAINP